MAPATVYRVWGKGRGHEPPSCASLVNEISGLSGARCLLWVISGHWCSVQRHVRFTPKADIRQRVEHVCLVP